MDISGDYKTNRMAEIILHHGPPGLERLLVVGCGSGTEAAVLAERLGAEVIGIDIRDDFDPQARELAQLEVGDAMALRFADSSFDYVYSYHALEHIEKPETALKEMKRVLKQGGGYLVGTPNRNRVLGYIGVDETTLGERIRMNAVDWKHRLSGRFKNELGAHAGFSSRELGGMLDRVFSNSREISTVYYKTIYGDKKWLFKLLHATGLARFAYPSVYFQGFKSTPS